MNWEGIRYIFQVPLSWFKAIHNRVFKAYGTNFIKVKEVQDGATEFAVDSQMFEQMVNQIVDQRPISGGDVKSVDNVLPDANGNVALNAVKTVDGVQPDATGDVDIGAVRSVDGFVPDQNGDVDLGAVRCVDGIYADSNGAVNLDALTSSDCDIPLGVPTLDQNGYLPVTKIEPLDASKIVVTDADGVLDTITGGHTGNVTFVTTVTWNGTTLQMKQRQLTFSKGIVTAVGSESTTTIDTPVTIT